MDVFNLDPELTEKLLELIVKRHAAVMLLLSLDVTRDSGNTIGTDGERAESALPSEAEQFLCTHGISDAMRKSLADGTSEMLKTVATAFAAAQDTGRTRFPWASPGEARG